MIPKIIHYCWFGREEKTKLVKKCIRSWKKYCPDYKIIEWNEDNYDIAAAPLFVRQAYDKRKWAFVSDYVRYYVVFEYGGIYMDTDVQIIKNIDFLLADTVFFGIQHLDLHPASGLGFGAVKGHGFIKELMGAYEGVSFILSEGKYNQIPCPDRDYALFCRYGFKLSDEEQILTNGVHIYPTEFFCPWIKGNPFLKKTKNTVMIHWFAASWLGDEHRINRRKQQYFDYFIYVPNRFGMRVLGMKRYNRLKRIFGRR